MTTLGFIGSHNPPSLRQRKTIRETLESLRQVHGVEWLHTSGCIETEEFAGRAWKELGGLVHVHPVDYRPNRGFFPADKLDRPRRYPRAGYRTLALSDIVVAAPSVPTYRSESRTWYLARHAIRLGRPVIVVWPDGSMSPWHGSSKEKSK